MARKDISHEEIFKNINPSLLQYSEDLQPVFDEILTVEERYCKGSLVDQGGVKKILKTIDSLTGRPVAKAILIDFEDPAKTESFLREARLTAALEHPNIMPVYDIGVDEVQGPFFTMKLAGGTNLASILKKLSKENSDFEYSLRELMLIFLKICDAISYAHSKGILHLDLKPENIQVGDFGEVLVCDWGLAKVMEEAENCSDFSADLDPSLYSDVTLDGMLKGTPGYMAPEQIKTGLYSKDRRTDIYALGGILYSLLSLKAPCESKTVEDILTETLLANIQAPSTRAVQGRFVPPSLEAVAMKALELRPEDRYQSVAELRLEINKWLGGFATEAENAGFVKSLWLLLKRHKAVSSLLLILLLSSLFAVYKVKQNEQTALANEKKAKDSLALYIREKELTGQISDHAIEQLKVMNEHYLEINAFDKAIELINKTLVFQPDSEVMNLLKGETHFYRQEFSKAVEAFQKAGTLTEKKPCSLMKTLAVEYAELLRNREFLEAKDLARLIFSFEGKYHTRIFSFEANKYNSLTKYQNFYSDPLKQPALDRHIELCRLLIIRRNPNIEDVKLICSFETDGINMDFSQNEFEDHLLYIRHLPLKSLNLENNFFWNQWIFSHEWLQSVNIKNTKLMKIDYNTLVNTRLKEIILSKKQFEESDIRGSVKNRIRFVIK